MFEPVKDKAVGLVNEFGRLCSSAQEKVAEPPKAEPLHPLDDPEVWRQAPAYDAPTSVDVVAAQKWIDSIMGTTRNNESIYKLIWNGDRRYWYEFYTSWDVLGNPTSEPTRRPRIRYKALRDPNTRKLIRDVFPPRWILLSRIEPEQYADTWKAESWVWDPNLKRKKQIRPDVPPEVFWVWYATIGAHNGTCCAVKQKNWDKCFGAYAPPQFAEGLLGIQKRADAAGGTRSVYEKVDPTFVSEVEDENNGYLLEMAEMEVEEQIYTENPLALIGVHASLKAGLDDPQRARQFVKDYYDRQKQELAKKL
jgi:hypothetical protein